MLEKAVEVKSSLLTCRELVQCRKQSNSSTVVRDSNQANLKENIGQLFE
jgi:hypothetical protein